MYYTILSNNLPVYGPENFLPENFLCVTINSIHIHMCCLQNTFHSPYPDVLLAKYFILSTSRCTVYTFHSTHPDALFVAYFPLSISPDVLAVCRIPYVNVLDTIHKPCSYMINSCALIFGHRYASHNGVAGF